MSRETIDLGIDLGTTNSAISRFAGGSVHIVKNTWNEETTPSAVRVDKAGNRVLVGRKARESAISDPDNVATEFKQQMGLDGAMKTFAASGRRMTPPELSAQVLMSLGRDLQNREGMELDAAVITVPAAFELHQCEATRQAAELAGVRVSPLLQEPTAAAFAYSYGRSVDKAYWLVFDLGGGTFDASVISVREGQFTVITHAGNNRLGGKDIDWGIVDKLLTPAVLAEHHLDGLVRGNQRQAGNIAKLKMAAETAKIELSTATECEVELIDLAIDTNQEFDVVVPLRRQDLEPIAQPCYRQAINLCRRALEEAQLPAGAIDRVILVGGATLAPGLREMLADPAEGLGIPIDHSQDPTTVVARGAAIFAGTQRLPRPSAPVPAGRFELRTEHALIGVDTEPLLGGRILGSEGHDWTGWAVELVNDAAMPPFRSGRIELAPNGTFMLRQLVEPNSHTEFQVELFDAQGRRRELQPDRLTYTHNVGAVPGEAVLTHAVGVGMANREMTWLLDKGMPLPAHRSVVLATVADVKRATDQGLIRIPVLEGDQPRAERNRQVGVMEITPRDITRDVHAGSDVEVELRIDESRKLTATAYVPILDEEFEMNVDMSTPKPPGAATLRRQVDELAGRIDTIREDVDQTDDSSAADDLRTLEQEQPIEQLETKLPAAEHDTDTAASCESQIIAAHIALDKIAAKLELPQLRADAENMLGMLRERVEPDGTAEERRELRSLENAVRVAIESSDLVALRRLVDRVRDALAASLNRTGELPVIRFNQLVSECDELGRTREMHTLIVEGETALSRRDVAQLRSVNSRLRQLLPRDVAPVDFSTLVDRRSHGR